MQQQKNKNNTKNYETIDKCIFKYCDKNQKKKFDMKYTYVIQGPYNMQ